MKHFKFLVFVCVLSLIAFSCENDDDMMEPQIVVEEEDEEIEEEPQQYERGFLITNEGSFTGGIGTVSFASEDLLDTTQNIFQVENGGDNLGTVVQSIGFDGDTAYIVANVSNRITVVNRFSFIEIARIETGLNNPRYFLAVNGKGYVTNWGDPLDAADDYVAVIDLNDYTVEATIPVPEGPELLISNGNNIYVANKGGFSVNNKVSVIDTTTDTVLTTIIVGDVPNGMQIVDNDLFILSGGSPAFTGMETGGSLSRIDLNLNTVVGQSTFETTQHPNLLNVNGNDLIYSLNGTVFITNAFNQSVPPVPLFSSNGFYNMTIIDGKLYGCNAGDFTSNGTIEVYDLSTGNLDATLEVGLIPGNVYRNE